MWFETLTGFREESPQQVRENLVVEGNVMKSLVNGNSFIWGELETPSLSELRERVRAVGYKTGKVALREIVADVRQLHLDTANEGALFQVASQFNLLEMAGPSTTPERGVGIYEYDHTQGPTCAIAAGAGTIYRNYFANVNGQTGQSADNQIDCLADLGLALGNSNNNLWEMQNGYAFASENGLNEISQRLRASNDEEVDALRQLLRIGIQWNTQVTPDNAKHLVSQAYCSALPVGYSSHSPALWQDFARFVLEASYEATICAAILNSARNGSNKLYLTLVGGGVFGNDYDWIANGILRALDLYRDADLEIGIVSYGRSNPDVQRIIGRTRNRL